MQAANKVFAQATVTASFKNATLSEILWEIQRKPWGNLSMNLRLKLTKSYTFNMNAQFATYAYEFDKDEQDKKSGRYIRKERYAGSCARLMLFSVEEQQTLFLQFA